MISVLDTLLFRRPKLNYVCPPVCEVNFSSSAGPVIVLEPIGKRKAPSGFIVSGSGHNFHLAWDNYPGALCYTVYKAVDELNPFGDYIVVAECIQDNFFDGDHGYYRVSAITTDGESEVGDPINVGVNPIPPPPEFPDPEAWWKMEEAAGNRIDIVNSHVLTPVNGFGHTTSLTGGKVNGGVLITPTADGFDYLASAAVPEFGFQQLGMTLVGWVNPGATEVPGCDIGISYVGGGNGFFVVSFDFTLGTVRGKLQQNSPFIWAHVDPSCPVSGWIFFALWFNAATQKIGMRINNNAPIETAMPAIDDKPNGSYSVFPYTGANFKVDELAFFRLCLTSDQIDTIYNNGNGTTWPIT